MGQGKKQQITIKGKSEPSAANPHYYLENGYVVFTEAYHLERGSCCGSGCRHCPYKKKRH
ncbi:MAG: hypothetical protein CFE21_02895 [Bacteroidetes bacterium B1(2017)]|nr:MAG: hypothetical protein CFE21_02895 [Bacteroidetes bacterium B1(2017)]